MTAGHASDEALLALLAGDLVDAERAALEDHLGACTVCQQTLAAFDEVMDVARAVHAVPQDLARRRGRLQLEATLRQEALKSRRTLRGGRLLLVAGVAALSGAALAMTASRVFAPPPAEAAPRGELNRSAPVRAVPTPTSAEPRSPVTSMPDSAAMFETSPSPDARGPGVGAGQARATPRRAERPERQADRSGEDAEGRRALSDHQQQPSPSAPSAAIPSPPPALPVTAPMPVGARAPDSAGLRVAKASGTPTSAQAYQGAKRHMAQAGPTAAGWADVGELAALAGDLEGAIDAWVTALSRRDGRRAAERLAQLVDAGDASVEDLEARVLASPSSAESAEGMRLLCAWGLIQRGDRAAVAVCQAFGRRFPDHPEVRALALSAGRTAEVRVGDLRLAEEEYSRAILVSQYAGLPGTSALFARARVRSKLGELEEARADLRLFLHVQPEAAFRDDVEALAQALRVALPDPLERR